MAEILVPVVDVQNDNIMEVWPSLVLAVKSATYIAMDTELSGLGNRRQLTAKDIDDRYKALLNITQTRAIVSLGISCFQLVDHNQTAKSDSNRTANHISPSGAGDSVKSELCSKKSKLNFRIQTFNIMMLCEDEYTVEPLSLKFLVEHGFDFNKQYAKGVSYYRGVDKADDNQDEASLRGLLRIIMQHSIPVVFHNAMVDLAFIYHSFYTSLPPTLGTFVSDLSEIFTGGVFDTKCVTEFFPRYIASYLEYVFRKCQRENYTSNGSESYVSLSFLKYPKSCDYVTNTICNVAPEDSSIKSPEIAALFRPWVCEMYSAHGWCPMSMQCPKSHDIDLIIDVEVQYPESEKKRKRTRKRRRVNTEGDDMVASGDTNETVMDIVPSHNDNVTDRSNDENLVVHKGDDNPSTSGTIRNGSSIDPVEPKVSVNDCTNTVDVSSNPSRPPCKFQEYLQNSRKGGHRAGYDAFMTGFIMSVYLAKYGRKEGLSVSEKSISDFAASEMINRVCLSGKDIPLTIGKSTFAKTSRLHREKLLRLKAQTGQ